MRTTSKLAIFFGIVFYLCLTFGFFIITLEHAEAWINSTLTMLPIVYFAIWSCYKVKNTRIQNICIGTGYLFLWIGIITLWIFMYELMPKFTADEFQLYCSHSRIAIISVGYGWFSVAVIVIAFVSAIFHLVIYAMVSPGDNPINNLTFSEALRQVERECNTGITPTTIMGAHMLDKTLNGRHKKHDHSLGSYWSDHDDNGNYDPGAWRRKYDKKQ